MNYTDTCCIGFLLTKILQRIIFHTMSSNGFWDKLPIPFFVLAPMADVTDAAFRRIIAKYGRPDVMWTEFVAADGLVRATEEGKKKNGKV